MLVHPVLLSHPRPQRILIVGGGDGGSLRECLKHDPLEVVMVEIDAAVIELSKRFLQFTAAGVFEDERLELIVDDAARVVRDYADHFDAVIVDSADEIGPSAVLYEEAFYADISRALKPDGVASFQVGSFLDADFVRRIAQRLRSVFELHTVYRLTMPVYNDGDYCISKKHGMFGPFEKVEDVTFDDAKGISLARGVLNGKEGDHPLAK